MSYLSEAFEPLLSNNKQSRGLDVFKKDWYNYDTERTSDNSTLKLSTMVPSLNRLNFDLNKPVKDNKKYCKRHEQSDFLFSFFLFCFASGLSDRHFHSTLSFKNHSK